MCQLADTLSTSATRKVCAKTAEGSQGTLCVASSVSMQYRDFFLRLANGVCASAFTKVLGPFAASVVRCPRIAMVQDLSRLSQELRASLEHPGMVEAEARKSFEHLSCEHLVNAWEVMIRKNPFKA